jgi:ribonuclease P/MRP protein subunit RPP40
LGDVFSDWVSANSGVPQGSVLGPILFIIYVNDLPESIANITKLYADDSKILVFYDSILQTNNLAMQYDLDQFAKWCEIWSMKLNIKKVQINAYW